MLLYYIRHGDPIYDPDSLTPLGLRQAEAVGKRLARAGIDRVFASTSNRAILTAKPLCEMAKKEMTLLDFCNENYTWMEFTYVSKDGARRWIFDDGDMELRRLLASESMERLGNEWYRHPDLPQGRFKEGLERVNRETDAFLETLGYRHDRAQRAYESIAPNEEKIALFAHQGFGLAFLSSVLDIPYPTFSTHANMTHTGVSVIEFGTGKFAVPRLLTLSSEAHLFAEGLPMKYNNYIPY